MCELEEYGFELKSGLKISYICGKLSKLLMVVMVVFDSGTSKTFICLSQQTAGVSL